MLIGQHETRVSTQDAQALLRLALADIQAFWPEMIDTEIRARRTGTIGRTDTRPLPIPVHVLDARRHTTDVLTAWALLIAEERDLNPHLDAGDVIGLAGFIDIHYDWLAAHDAGPDAIDEINACARTVRRIARPEPRPEQAFVGPCQCGERLHAPREEQLIRCHTCGRTTHRDDLRDAALTVARDALCTAKEAERMGAALNVAVKAGTVRAWASRGRILPVGHGPDGQPRYRFREIESLIAIA